MNRTHRNYVAFKCPKNVTNLQHVSDIYNAASGIPIDSKMQSVTDYSLWYYNWPTTPNFSLMMFCNYSFFCYRSCNISMPYLEGIDAVSEVGSLCFALCREKCVISERFAWNFSLPLRKQQKPFYPLPHSFSSRNLHFSILFVFSLKNFGNANDQPYEVL